MRNQWRLLLRHNICSTNPRFSRPLFHHHHHAQVSSSSSFSTLSPTPFPPHLPNTFKTPSPFSYFHRYYSSESPIISKSPHTSIIINLFSKPVDSHDDIHKEVESNNVVITSDLLHEVLTDLTTYPDTALNFFNWVLVAHNHCVGLTAYNLMLAILGTHGYIEQLWGLLDDMKNKGFRVRRRSFDVVWDRFHKDGLQADIDRFMASYAEDLGWTFKTMASRVSKIVRNRVWDDSLEEELKHLDLPYSTDLVNMVLHKLADVPLKGFIFFRWVEESGSFKHDHLSYNSMLMLLATPDCVDRFWSVTGDMRLSGFNMDLTTFVKVLQSFIHHRLMADAVSLYEFAMNGVNKPSTQDCIFLLRKLSTAKELDMELFSRVVKAFTRHGFALEDSMFDAVLKALTSVGRMRECNKVLDVMLEVGFVPSGAMQGRLAFDLSSSKMTDETNEFMEKLKDHGFTSDYSTWVSLIEGHCVAGDLDKATESFKTMVEQEEVSDAGYPLDLLANAYCTRQRASEACKVLTDLVNKGKVEPHHATFKTLISQLVDQKGFREALPLLGLMKNHGFPPFLDPFVQYISRKGTSDEALLFFKAMTVKKFPSTNVILGVFEAYSKAGRYKQAQNLLAKCPQFIRNNADVLNLFCAMKTEKLPETVAVAP